MNIAIIGTGNVGGTLATKWASAGHQIFLGVRDLQNFKGKSLLNHSTIQAKMIAEAVQLSEVVLLATPATSAIQVAQSLGNTSGKVIIDTMNIVMGKGPEGFSNTTDAILANTTSNDVVKCFNTIGFNNMADPIYDGQAIDVFMAGDSESAKAITRQLALEIGFGACYDVGGNDKFELMEQFAWFWINLAIFQGEGREIAFKLLKR